MQIQSNLMHLGSQLGKTEDEAIEDSFMIGDFDVPPKQEHELTSD